jgi:hypothetical protein
MREVARMVKAAALHDGRESYEVALLIDGVSGETRIPPSPLG